MIQIFLLSDIPCRFVNEAFNTAIKCAIYFWTSNFLVFLWLRCSLCSWTPRWTSTILELLNFLAHLVLIVNFILIIVLLLIWFNKWKRSLFVTFLWHLSIAYKIWLLRRMLWVFTNIPYFLNIFHFFVLIYKSTLRQKNFDSVAVILKKWKWIIRRLA